MVRSESRLNSVSVSEGADLASSDRSSQFWPEAVSNSEIDDVASDVDIFFFLFFFFFELTVGIAMGKDIVWRENLRMEKRETIWRFKRGRST